MLTIGTIFPYLVETVTSIIQRSVCHSRHKLQLQIIQAQTPAATEKKKKVNQESKPCPPSERERSLDSRNYRIHDTAITPPKPTVVRHYRTPHDISRNAISSIGNFQYTPILHIPILTKRIQNYIGQVPIAKVPGLADMYKPQQSSYYYCMHTQGTATMASKM